MMKRITLSVLAALGTLGTAHLASAAETASALLVLKSTNTAVSPTQYTYSMTLTDTGTTTVGSFWYAWIPGEDFLTTSPLSVSNPTGWQDIITTGGTAGVNNGYAIQWKASTGTTPVAGGASLAGFEFTTIDSLASISGNSAYYSTTPAGTSFIYSGAPFSDGGFQFTVTSTPEPATIGFLAMAFPLLARRRVAV